MRAAGSAIAPWLAAAAVLWPAAGPQAQPVASRPEILFVWMGGDDCPPCVAWRRTELPQLRQSPVWQEVRFSYVVKSIRSTVPAAADLPPEVRPYKDLLDRAGAGRSGSPQAALIVDGAVYDYFTSARMAGDVERMLIAIRQGTRYPFQRCLRLGARRGECEIAG